MRHLTFLSLEGPTFSPPEHLRLFSLKDPDSCPGRPQTHQPKGPTPPPPETAKPPHPRRPVPPPGDPKTSQPEGRLALRGRRCSVPRLSRNPQTLPWGTFTPLSGTALMAGQTPSQQAGLRVSLALLWLAPQDAPQTPAATSPQMPLLPLLRWAQLQGGERNQAQLQSAGLSWLAEPLPSHQCAPRLSPTCSHPCWGPHILLLWTPCPDGEDRPGSGHWWGLSPPLSPFSLHRHLGPYQPLSQNGVPLVVPAP